MEKMSSQKNQKMCKSPQKNLTAFQKEQKQQKEIGSYEVLNTNCTMVGSNNLTLDSKINYLTPQIKVCAKPTKSNPEIIKKPQSPRNISMETFIHNSMIQNTKFSPNFTHHVRPIVTQNFTKATYDNQSFQQRISVNKSPVPNYSSMPNVISNVQANSSLNNGGNMCNMSPSAYSNPSPSYPSNSVSPYNVQISSPANSVSSITSGVAGIKSPIPSPQNIRPPTPQPILPQAFQQIPVMTSGPNLVQIIHAPNNQQTYQNHPMLARQTIIASQQQNIQNTSPIIKIKPPLNILPKPPSTSTNSKTVVRTTQNQPPPIQSPSQQIVLPNQTILPAAQTAGTLLLNQMPLIVQQNTAQGVQLILRPGTPNSGQMGGKLQPQNLILQQGHNQQPTVLIQHGNRNQTLQQVNPQQLVRVLTANGMIQGLAPTYIAMNNQQLNIQQLSAQAAAQHHSNQHQSQTQQIKQQVNIQQGIINACLPGPVNSVVSNPSPGIAPVTSSIEQLPPPKRKPKKKKKNKEPKLDLANIMKLSGIGDDDDVHFESDTSESALSSDNQSTHHNLASKSQKSESHSTPSTPEMETHMNFPKRIGNIHISAVTQDMSKISQNTTSTNAILEKHFTQTSQISVQQSLSDINAINQNLTQIGILNQNSAQNFLNNSMAQNSLNLSQANTPNLLNQDSQSLANFLQALNHNSTFLNGQNVSQSVIPVSSMPGLTTFATNSQATTLTTNYPKFSVPTTNSTNFGANLVSNLVSSPQNISSSQNISSENVLNIPKGVIFSQAQTTRPTPSPASILTNQAIQNLNQNAHQNSMIQNLNQSVPGLTNAHFNLSNPLSNIQVQNFGNQNLFLNQGTNTIIAPNIPNFSGNITINNGLIPNTNLTLPNNLVPNFLPTNLVQPTQDNSFAGNNMQRTGGFKLALSEDGRLILQHDPNLNQDIQSQLLLQSIFGINIPGNNLVLTSVNNPVQQPQAKPIAVVEPKKQEITSTKTTNIIQNSIPSVRTDPSGEQSGPPGAPNNFSYIVNLTPEQLETLKRNGQLTVNGQTIFMHRPKNQEPEKVKSSPKAKTTKKKTHYEPKSAKTALQEHLGVKNHIENKTVATQSTNSSLISALQAPAKNVMMPQMNSQVMLPQGVPQVNIEPKIMQHEYPGLPQNVVCVQPNNSKIPNQNISVKNDLMIHKKPIVKKIQEPVVILPQNKLPIAEKKDKKEELFQNSDNGEVGVNVEQFLNNLNINPANLGQLISQKLPGGIDHKIVNISSGSTAGHIVAKIDISSENMQQILSSSTETTKTQTVNTSNNVVLPPLVSMKQEPTENVFNVPAPTENIQNSQLPLVIASNNATLPSEPPLPMGPSIEGPSTPGPPRSNNTVYQRIQTIQLTPQKQQLLRSVQLQIQTLTARLQQKNEKGISDTQKSGDASIVPDAEIHRTLKLLFVEQQKILATGKVIPTINQQVAAINSHIDSLPTQSIPVSTASKNNNTFLTSLLQQPVVSNNKKIFHHRNETINYPQNTPTPVVSAISNANANQIALKLKKMPIPNQPSSSSNVTFLPSIKVAEKTITQSQEVKSANCMVSNTPVLLSPKKMPKPMFSKAQLIEQQMTTDQNGAINPDITTPFASKADACKRLVRYHCYNQPVLSQKDLNKADEIFELTARHFIEKFKMMVNKYKFLLLKESMREVQTSELMMIDRMFLAEEQQSLMKAQNDLKMQSEMDMHQNIETTLKEMYGEASINEDVKPDLLIQNLDKPKSLLENKNYHENYPKNENFTVKTENCAEKNEFDDNPDFNIKCGLNYFSDGSCDSGNFQVYEGSPKFDEFSGKNESFNPNNDKKETKNLESYNTTKIIGNFEIEINNKGSQESFTKNFRQKIIDNKEIHIKSHERKQEEGFENRTAEQNEQYDEWLCIQRELGYFPENKDDKTGETSELTAEYKQKHDEIFKKSSHKRSSTESNRLETLKKFRVEKHNSKVKKTGSIIGEVKFEVRIEHKKVFPEQKKDLEYKQNSSKRGYEFQKSENESFNKRQCISQNFKSEFSSPFHNIKTEDSGNNDEIFDRSIDEQVQSAIDSILNLQQITSMGTDKGEGSKSKESDFGVKNSDEGDSSLALDEAVKSILS